MAEEIRSILGIVAGQGVYPAILAERLIGRGHRVAVACIRGHCSAELPPECGPVERFPLGALGAKARFFKAQGVRQVFFAGGVERRGALRSLRPDRHGIPLLFKAFAGGDDQLLTAAAERFAKLGLEVADPTFLIEDLLAGEGLLAGPEPGRAVRADLELAWRGAVELGRGDAGQAVVARRGKIIAREDKGGTDALIGRVSAGGAVLAKAVKPNQDRRFDRPAVGPMTALACKAAGITAIAVQAGGVILLERGLFIDLCNRHGISVVGISA